MQQRVHGAAFRRWLKPRRAHWQLYAMLLPALAWLIIFCYIPMYGASLAFKDFNFAKGIIGSDWVGLKQFCRLFKSYWFPTIMRNTLNISGLSLIISFPVPILLALMINEIQHTRLKKLFQTVSYAPHFISTIVVCGMVMLFLNPSSGIINQILAGLGGQRIFFMQKPHMFKWIYILSGIWQDAGWSAIIYFAALSGVDASLIEAAEIDGASRLQKIWYINLPVLVPTIVILFIMQCGSILSVGYEKVYALQNSANMRASEVISTYVYKLGLEQKDFSFSTATGLFNSVINAVFLVLSNTLSRKAAHISMF